VQQLLAVAIVTIRIYNYAAVPSEQVAAARAAADGIFRESGISLQWIDCRVPGAALGDGCAGLLGESEFVLRLLELPDLNQSTANKANPGRANPGRANPGKGNPNTVNPNTVRHLALGSSLIDVDTHAGVLITVDPARTAAIATQARIDPALVLGRAIAHELGHMLLGTSRHAETGLMRALWSQRELRDNNPSDWQFSPVEAGAMRHGLSVRTRAAN
jgi:hypothetical protein